MFYVDLEPRQLADDNAVYRITLSISPDIVGVDGAVPLGVPPKWMAISFPVQEDDDLIEMATFLRDHVQKILADYGDFHESDNPEPGE